MDKKKEIIADVMKILKSGDDSIINTLWWNAKAYLQCIESKREENEMKEKLQDNEKKLCDMEETLNYLKIETRKLEYAEHGVKIIKD